MEQSIQIQVSPEELRALITEAINAAVPGAVAKGLPPEKHFLSRLEVAEKLGISLTTVHELIKQGKLIPKKVGRRTLFVISEVLNLPYEKYQRTHKDIKP